jgi:hypothetical protein
MGGMGEVRGRRERGKEWGVQFGFFPLNLGNIYIVVGKRFGLVSLKKFP